MREQNANRWSRRLVLLLVPVALVAAFAVSGAPALSQAGTITVTSEDTESQSHVILEDGVVRFLGGLGKGAFLGVTLEEETELDEGGARVTNVVDESPAAEAGIEEGDVIVGFDGETIRGPVALTKEIHGKEPGDVVSIVVVRGGSRRTLEATLGDRADKWALDFAPWSEALGHLNDIYVPAIPELPDIDLELQEKLLQESLSGLEDLRWFGCDDKDDEDCKSTWVFWSGRPRLGVQLVEVTPELRRHMGAAEDAGVMVSKVISGTPAESAGVRVGDLIVAVDGERISGTSALRKALHDKTGKTFELEVVRDRTPVRLQVSIPEPENEVPTGPRARLHVLPRPAQAPRAVAAAPVRPAPAAAPEPVAPPAVPAPVAPTLRHRDVVRVSGEAREELARTRALARAVAREDLDRERALARAEVREVREKLAQERALARAEARQDLDRERALARAEARKVREAARESIGRARGLPQRQRSIERQGELRRRLSSITLL